MSCLGVHFALTEKEAAHLRSLGDEQARLDHLQESIEETYFNEHPELKAESDKAWDAMHRTLADGELTWDGGESYGPDGAPPNGTGLRSFDTGVNVGAIARYGGLGKDRTAKH